jgi:riboflavin synthase
MFTGLIEETGIIKKIKVSGAGRIFSVSADSVINGLKTGDSVSINGACQTVTLVNGKIFEIFASKITCEISTLGILKESSRVNLERAMSASSRFGGHIVQGHVDGRGRVGKISNDENGIKIQIIASQDIMRYIVPRCSVAVDGISLTVVSVDKDGFHLYVIPESLKRTTAIEWTTGSEVNIETDILAKYVEKMLENKNNKSINNDNNLMQKLYEEGFV